MMMKISNTHINCLCIDLATFVEDDALVCLILRSVSEEIVIALSTLDIGR